MNIIMNNNINEKPFRVSLINFERKWILHTIERRFVVHHHNKKNTLFITTCTLRTKMGSPCHWTENNYIVMQHYLNFTNKNGFSMSLNSVWGRHHYCKNNYTVYSLWFESNQIESSYYLLVLHFYTSLTKRIQCNYLLRASHLYTIYLLTHAVVHYSFLYI